MGFNRFFGASILSLAILVGCGGGGDGTAPAAGGGAPVAGAGIITGTAGSGSPVVGGTVTVTDSSNPVLTRTTTTNADGTFTVPDTASLTYPVRLTVSFAEGGAIRTLRSLAVAESNDEATRANITPITDVIAGSVLNIPDVATLNTEIARLTAIIRNALANYGIPANADFLGGAYTAAPSDPVDNALDMVSVQLSGGNIVLQSTSDPSVAVEIPADTMDPETVAELPAPVPTASASPVDIKTLVDAFGSALSQGADLAASDLDNVFHDDFQDDEGFTKASFAEGIAAEAEEGLELTVTGYRILRCFADAGLITDKCYIRVSFTSPTLADEDFGGTAGEATVSDFIDLIAERRTVNSVAGPLKFSGGFFKPFSANIKLFNLNVVSVDGSGVAQESEAVSKGLSIDARVGGDEPATLANSNLKTIELVRNLDSEDLNAPESILMSVTRSLSGQCVGSDNRLNLDPSAGQCGNQKFDGVSSVAADSAAGRLTAVFIRNDDTEFDVPNVRIVDPTSSSLSSFGTLNQASLQNLTSYSMGSGSGTVQITLTPPDGAAFICISDGGNNDDICTYASRTVTISSTQLSRQSTYFILTRDAENNTFQREYRLNQSVLALPSAPAEASR